MSLTKALLLFARAGSDAFRDRRAVHGPRARRRRRRRQAGWSGSFVDAFHVRSMQTRERSVRVLAAPPQGDPGPLGDCAPICPFADPGWRGAWPIWFGLHGGRGHHAGVRARTRPVQLSDFPVPRVGGMGRWRYVHGFPDSPDSYRNLLPALVEAGFRVVAPFCRGLASTELPGLTPELPAK